VRAKKKKKKAFLPHYARYYEAVDYDADVISYVDKLLATIRYDYYATTLLPHITAILPLYARHYYIRYDIERANMPHWLLLGGVRHCRCFFATLPADTSDTRDYDTLEILITAATIPFITRADAGFEGLARLHAATRAIRFIGCH